MLNYSGHNMSGVYVGSQEMEAIYKGDQLVYHKPGTYVDVLYSGDMTSPGVSSRYHGYLTDKIQNYDMITVFPGHGNTEGAIGSKFSPKDLSENTKTHLFTLAGQGGFYLIDQILEWKNGNEFSAYPINHSVSSTCQFYNSTVSGTTAKNWRNYTNYTSGHCGISMIVGTKYYGNRDLLYSADPLDNITLCNLSKPITAYDKLQVHIDLTYTGKSQYENGGWWTEIYNDPTNLKGFRVTGFIGAGGGAYLNQLPCKFISNTQISACNDIAYSFKWFLNSTATPVRTKTHSLAIQEIWGVKDA